MSVNGKYERIRQAWFVFRTFSLFFTFAKLVVSTVLFKPNDAIQTAHNENKQAFNSAVDVYLVERH